MEDFERWEKISEWRGYTLKALEDVSEELKDLKEDIHSLNDKIDVINGKLTAQAIKVGVAGGIMGLIAGGVISVLL